jgi:hypothetical protein
MMSLTKEKYYQLEIHLKDLDERFGKICRIFQSIDVGDLPDGSGTASPAAEKKEDDSTFDASAKPALAITGRLADLVEDINKEAKSVEMKAGVPDLQSVEIKDVIYNPDTNEHALRLFDTVGGAEGLLMVGEAHAKECRRALADDRIMINLTDKEAKSIGWSEARPEYLEDKSVPADNEGSD